MGVTLPSENWFAQIQGERIIRNTYTGSCGTNPARGCISEKVFNYKVYVQGDSPEKLSLVAECCTQLPWSNDLKKTNHTRHETVFNADGIREISEWLSVQSQTQNKFQL